jgi:hypothetical protein
MPNAAGVVHVGSSTGQSLALIVQDGPGTRGAALPMARNAARSASRAVPDRRWLVKNQAIVGRNPRRPRLATAALFALGDAQLGVARRYSAERELMAPEQ